MKSGNEGIPTSIHVPIKISSTDHVASTVRSCPTSARAYEIEAKDLCYKVEKSSSPADILISCRKFFGLSVGVVDEESSKYILNNVSFKAKPREILAIAGPSGAGKSTLLEILAGRIKASSPSGNVMINQQPVGASFLSKNCGYVSQDDVLFPFLTVEETLRFSARMRLPPSIPRIKKEERVREIMSELGLQHVAHTPIGNEDIRGVSGGERRRVSIGVDVIHDPPLLLLDEPTSCLDSASALHVMEMLHRMATTRSRTIILSIHQPSYRILQLIPSVLLMAKGSVIHHGSLDSLQQRLLATGHHVPRQVTVLEFVIDAMTTGAGLKLHKTEQKSESNYAHDLIAAAVDESMNKGNKQGDETLVQDSQNTENDNPNLESANNGIEEIILLSQRFSQNLYRTPKLFLSRTIQAVAIAVGLGSLYRNVGYDLRGVEERLGLFAFILACLVCASLEDLPILLEERQVLMRETSRGAYRMSSYVASNMLVFLPFLLFFSVISSIPVYWLAGLNSSWKAFSFFVLIFWLMLVASNSLVAFFSALTPSYIMANSLISSFTSACYLFSGYFIPTKSIPVYWKFMHYLSFFKYPLDAMLINEFSGIDDQCFGPRIGDVCMTTAQDVLAQFGLDKESKWIDVAVMIVFICIYRGLGLVALHAKVSRGKA